MHITRPTGVRSSGYNSKTNFADEMQQLCSKVADDDFIKGVFSVKVIHLL